MIPPAPSTKGEDKDGADAPAKSADASKSDVTDAGKAEGDEKEKEEGAKEEEGGKTTFGIRKKNGKVCHASRLHSKSFPIL